MVEAEEGRYTVRCIKASRTRHWQQHWTRWTKVSPKLVWRRNEVLNVIVVSLTFLRCAPTGTHKNTERGASLCSSIGLAAIENDDEISMGGPVSSYDRGESVQRPSEPNQLCQ